MTLSIVIADDDSLNDKVFKTNHLGQIFIPRPSKRCVAVSTMTFGDGKTVNMSLIFQQASWMSYDFGANYETDMQLTTKYPGFFPGMTNTHIQRNLTDSELKIMKEKIR